MHAAPPFDQSPIPYVGGPRRAFVHAVHDGDTFWCAIDLGFGDHHSNPEKGSRLVGPSAKGFNTPELNSTSRIVQLAAKAARDRVEILIEKRFVYVESWPPNADDKYGRWLMAVYVPVTFQPNVPPWAVPINVGPQPDPVPCFDLASQLVAENLGEWKDF